MKFGPVVQDEMSFKEKRLQTHGGRTMNYGQRPIIIAHLEPSAQMN